MAFKRKQVSITPSQITSDQDDYNPTGFSGANVIRVSGDNGFRAITSFAAQSVGSIKIIENVGSYPIYFPGNHPDATSTNRFKIGKDFILFPKRTVRVVYNGSNWLILDTDDGLDNRNGLKTIQHAISAGTTTTNDIAYYTFVTSGGGFGTSSSSSTAPMRMSISTATSSTGQSSFYISKSVIQYGAFGSGHLYMQCFINIPTLSTGSETFTTYFGICNDATSAIPGANSIGIKYTHGTNSGKFYGSSINSGGTESTSDTGITVTAGQYYLLRCEVDKSLTEVRFYIDGMYATRITSNLPSAATTVTKVAINKSVGTTSRSIEYAGVATGIIYI